jgi:hypothetical protein
MNALPGPHGHGERDPHGKSGGTEMRNFTRWHQIIATVSPLVRSGQTARKARRTARMAGVLAVASGAAIFTLTPGIASAASGIPAVPQVQAVKTVPPNSDFDFRVAGVRIFNSTDTTTARVNGLGYPGQGFGSSDGPEYGTPYTCDNGQTTTTYVYGTDQTTQISGFVPLCNLVSLT